MREILFRGKTNKLDWVYGDLIQLNDGRKFIVNNKFGACIDDKGNFINTEAPFVCNVFPESVSEFTGLTDKNGTKIFEGDIHEHIVGGKSYLFIVKHGKYYDFEAADKRYGWYFQNTKTNDCNSFYGDENDYANIIGNIHDNPELLGGGEE